MYFSILIKSFMTIFISILMYKWTIVLYLNFTLWGVVIFFLIKATQKQKKKLKDVIIIQHVTHYVINTIYLISPWRAISSMIFLVGICKTLSMICRTPFEHQMSLVTILASIWLPSMVNPITDTKRDYILTFYFLNTAINAHCSEVNE